MAARSSITAVLDGAPDMVFRKITDIARLPEWNAAMTKVVEAPAELEPGAEWVVEFHALGQRWRSRSRVEQLDAEARRFAYRSWTDDGNPSYASWSWEVAEDPAGSRVTVAWELASRHVLAAGVAGPHPGAPAFPTRAARVADRARCGRQGGRATLQSRIRLSVDKGPGGAGR